jgi:hypothetical protein
MPQNSGNEGLRGGLDRRGDKSGNRLTTGRGQNRPDLHFPDERPGQEERR